MNRITLIGRLGKDPEVSYLPDETQVAKVTLATSNDYKKGDDWVKKPPSWHSIIAYRKVAEELGAYLKGSLLQIEGKVNYKEWTDKQGNKRKDTEIIAFSVQVPKQKTEDGTPFWEGL